MYMKRRSKSHRRTKRQVGKALVTWLDAWNTAGRAVPKIHPGELLREEFMKPLGLTPEMMAKSIPQHPKFPKSDITENLRDLLIADEDSLLDIDLSLALDRYFGLHAGFFWRVQADHDIHEWCNKEAEWLARVVPLKCSRAHRP
jgi:plasmid maintenance system antidote protein VapI